MGPTTTTEAEQPFTARQIKAGMVVRIDDVHYHVRGVEQMVDLADGSSRVLTHDGVPAVKLDVCRRPGHRMDEQRFEFYIRADEEVEEIKEVIELEG